MSRFEITSGAMVCSDPCYTTDVWCMGTINNVKKGTWSAEVDELDGGRIAQLRVHHTDSGVETMSSKWERITGSFGVDSGQFGFFDSEHHRKADSVKHMDKADFGVNYDETPEDEWYRACCDLTLSDESWGVLPNGAVSTSGYGDGCYDVYGLKNANEEYIALTVVFIDQYETDDDEDDEYDNDDEN